MGRRRKTRELVLALTNGLLDTTVNLLLWQVYYTGALFGKKRVAGSFWQAFYEANDLLQEFNAQTIRSAIRCLVKKGFILLSEDSSSVKITQAGLKKLKTKIPFYDEERTWDKRIYLIIYDIPEKQKSVRDILRNYLRRIGCAKLQASVWITPYNPKEVLEEFLTQHNLHGLVLVSSLGKDGSIGKERIEDLISKVYNLARLNQRYKEFIKRYDKTENSQELVFDYFSILKDDPQLPFELLPQDWLGEKAHNLFLRAKEKRGYT